MNNKGYLLIESLLSIGITLTIVTIIGSIMFVSAKIKTDIEDKVELQQQAWEVSEYVTGIIESSKGIIGIRTKSNTESPPIDGSEVDAVSIKCKYKDENSATEENKEISLKSSRKIFINSIYDNGSSKPGGYEIGAYIDNIFIKPYNKGRNVEIGLKLSKNKQKYYLKFNIDIKNFSELGEGDVV